MLIIMHLSICNMSRVVASIILYKTVLGFCRDVDMRIFLIGKRCGFEFSRVKDKSEFRSQFHWNVGYLSRKALTLLWWTCQQLRCRSTKYSARFSSVICSHTQEPQSPDGRQATIQIFRFNEVSPERSSWKPLASACSILVWACDLSTTDGDNLGFYFSQLSSAELTESLIAIFMRFVDFNKTSA